MKICSPIVDIPCDLTWVRVIAIKILVTMDEETELLEFLFGRRFPLWDIKVSKRGQRYVDLYITFPIS